MVYLMSPFAQLAYDSVDHNRMTFSAKRKQSQNACATGHFEDQSQQRHANYSQPHFALIF